MAGNKYKSVNTERVTANGRVIKFRSKLEAKWSRYLDLLIRDGEIKYYDYEPFYFEFPEIRHGVTRYKPDFKIYLPDGSVRWEELKGCLNPKSLTRIRRFAKYYPFEKLHLIFDGVPDRRIRSKKRIAIEKIAPFVSRIVDASVIFRQLAMK